MQDEASDAAATTPRATGPASPPQRSVVYSAAFVLGMVITLVGVIAALFGFGKSSSIDIDAFDVTVKTTSVGLGVMFLGVVMMVLLAKFKPKDVQLFADGATVVREPDLLERLMAWFSDGRHALVTAVILLALLGISLGVTQ